MPAAKLIEQFTLKPGEKSITVPKVAQMTMSDLTEGVDMTDSEDIGMTTTSLTATEKGLKVVLTDKLVREENESPIKMVGRQLGDASARKQDTDVISLYSGFSRTLGADGKNLNFQNLAACISVVKANKYPVPLFVVHHPNAVFDIFKSFNANTGGTATNVDAGPTASTLKNFYKWSFNGVDIFEDGNVPKEAGVDSGIGCIFSRGAMAFVTEKGFTTETERDASLRANELVATKDYGVFELDDAYGASMQYEIGDFATNN
jgi:hypothetical protein